MAEQFPKQVILEPHEIARINRVRLAIRFNTLPSVIDAQPYRDIEDMINILNVEDKLAAKKRANSNG